MSLIDVEMTNAVDDVETSDDADDIETSDDSPVCKIHVQALLYNTIYR